MNIDRKIFNTRTVFEILELLANEEFEVQKGDDLILSMASNLYDDTKGICFVNKLTIENIQAISNKKSSFIISPKSTIKDLIKKDRSSWIVFVSNPRLSFIKLISNLLNKPHNPGIDPSSKIHPNAKIGSGTFIGPFCSIGEVEIGENCIIEASVTIKDYVRIGNNVTIKSSTSIGGDGFGFQFDPESDRSLSFPHLGGVVIGNNVHIGSSVSIDRGVLNDTIIHENCRLDNLVHIAHNVVIKRNTSLAAHAMVAGSAKIGEKCWISPGANILDKISIGDNVTIGIGAVVMKDVPANSTYVGAPARSIKDHKKMLNFIEENI